MPESADPGSEWLSGYDNRSGSKTVVPAFWYDHPVLGKHIRKTPLTKAAESKTPVANNDTPAAGDKEK